MSDISHKIKPRLPALYNKTALHDPTDVVYGKQSIKAALCPQCGVTYSNDPFVLLHPVLTESGQPVKWSAFSTTVNTGKKKPPMYIVNPIFRDLPITVIRQGHRSVKGPHIVKSIDIVTLGQDTSVSIQGFFNLQTQRFYAFPSEFTLGRIKVRPLHHLELMDRKIFWGNPKRSALFYRPCKPIRTHTCRSWSGRKNIGKPCWSPPIRVSFIPYFCNGRPTATAALTAVSPLPGRRS